MVPSLSVATVPVFGNVYSFITEHKPFPARRSPRSCQQPEELRHSLAEGWSLQGRRYGWPVGRYLQKTMRFVQAASSAGRLGLLNVKERCSCWKGSFNS
jgi:hypothetical protein